MLTNVPFMQPWAVMPTLYSVYDTVWNSELFQIQKFSVFNSHSLIFLHAYNFASPSSPLWCRVIYLSFSTLLPTFSPSLLLLRLRNPRVVVNYDLIQVFLWRPTFPRSLRLNNKRDITLNMQPAEMTAVFPSNAHTHKSHQVITVFCLKKN